MMSLLRQDGQVVEAILMFLIFTVGGTEQKLGAAMHGGPDSWSIKAPSIPVLAAHIKAALRRLELQEAEVAETISFREIELNPLRRTIRKRDQVLHLTPKEFDLVHYLMARAGIPVRHSELLRKIWGIE
jgi:two-component system KDP operon response regulator KdpE